MTSFSAAEEPDFVTVGNELLPAFERCNFFGREANYARISHTFYIAYISIEKIVCGFEEVHNYCQERYHDHQDGSLGDVVEMEKRVVCYLLGRAYTSPTLQVVLSSSTWLEPMCVGLTANPTKVSLHIQFLGSDVHMGDSLQHTALFLARSSSTRALHISSSNILVGYGPSIAQAVRTNKLHMLDITNVGSHSRGTQSLPEVTGTDDEIGDRIQSEHIAEALIENTSIKVLRVKAVSPFVNSFVLRNPTAANQHVEDLTLVFVENVDLLELNDVLSTNQTLRKIKLLNAYFSQSMWMQLVDSLKTNTVLEVLDIGSSTGWIDQAVLSALLNLVRIHCTQIIDFGFNELSDYFVRDNDILKEALPALNEQLRLNSE